MEWLDAFKNDPVSFMQQNSLGVALALVFLAVGIAIYGIYVLVGDRTLARKRLHAGVSSDFSEGASSQLQPLRFHEEKKGWLKAFAPIYEPLLPRDEEKLTELRKQMIQAGYMHPYAAIKYYALRITLAALLGAGVLFLTPIVAPSVPLNFYFIGALMASVAGYLVPGVVLDSRISKRKRSIREGFPDALDMLLVCMEAGLALDAALARVGNEIERAHPVISEHFKLVGNELRVGRTRSEALRNLSERTGVEEVRALVNLLIQSDELGTSVAKALRVHAFEMRAARILRAEELAHKVPVKMAFPLMFGFIPVVILATVTPAALKMMEFIFPILTNSSSPMEGL